jgi:hypothetical protein
MDRSRNSAIAKVALRGAAASVPASLIIMYWARQWSILSFLLWALVLSPAAAVTAAVVWMFSSGRSRSASRGVVLVLLGAIVGVLLVEIEALVFSAIRPKLLPDPLAPSNIVPGVVIGVLAAYLVVNLVPVEAKPSTE